MKRTYMKPTTKVVPIQQRQMLCASPYDDKTAPLKTYDSDADVINEKGNIW